MSKTLLPTKNGQGTGFSEQMNENRSVKWKKSLLNRPVEKFKLCARRSDCTLLSGALLAKKFSGQFRNRTVGGSLRFSCESLWRTLACQPPPPAVPTRIPAPLEQIAKRGVSCIASDAECPRGRLRAKTKRQRVRIFGSLPAPQKRPTEGFMGAWETFGRRRGSVGDRPQQWPQHGARGQKRSVSGCEFLVLSRPRRNDRPHQGATTERLAFRRYASAFCRAAYHSLHHWMTL